MIEPFFFAGRSGQLFGIYHCPRGVRRPRMGVVLCYPVGQEYIRAHRAFLCLARLLAEQGVAVLRFDYHGCGDSTGECSRGTPRQWVEDISQAVEELQRDHACRMTLVGLRLGATLALLCAAERQDIEQIVLWEPVVRGEDYLREIIARHETWLAGSFARSGPRPEPGIVGETLGFPITAPMQAACSQYCDLLAVTGKPAGRILVIGCEATADQRALAGRLEELGVEVTPLHLRHLHVWEKGGQSEEKGLVPLDVLQAIRTWICRMPL